MKTMSSGLGRVLKVSRGDEVEGGAFIGDELKAVLAVDDALAGKLSLLPGPPCLIVGSGRGAERQGGSRGRWCTATDGNGNHETDLGKQDEMTEAFTLRDFSRLEFGL
jgi:hypothetical protein